MYRFELVCIVCIVLPSFRFRGYATTHWLVYSKQMNLFPVRVFSFLAVIIVCHLLDLYAICWRVRNTGHETCWLVSLDSTFSCMCLLRHSLANTVLLALLCVVSTCSWNVPENCLQCTTFPFPNMLCLQELAFPGVLPLWWLSDTPQVILSRSSKTPRAGTTALGE